MSKEDHPPRRSTHVEMPATYAAVGASQADDLLRFPPEGSTPFEKQVLLGSGEERFITASSSLMTWGAQRVAGVTVEVVHHEETPVYRGVDFTDEGVPEPQGSEEQRFAPDGTPFLTAGTVVRFSWTDSDLTREVRVVSVLDEPNRAGFVIGTADTSGVTGEEFFAVEQREDGTVWASVRGFLVPPKEGLLGIKGKSSLKQAVARAEAQIQALTPVGSAAAAQPPGSESPNGE